MARFEVFIPASGPEGMALTLRVNAETWMAALKLGLTKIGEAGALPQNVLCDIGDDESIHVTDPRSSRVFRIVELREKPPPPPEEARTDPELAPLAPRVAQPAPPPRKPEPPPPRTAQPPPKSEPPRPRPTAAREPDPATKKAEDVLVDLFERTPAVFGKGRDEALYFLLDLAMEKIPADAGSVYVADLNRRDLRFAAARGPKADALLKLGMTVPMGRGFVGFCAQEGVGIAINDAQRDPRFYKEVADRLGYETKSIMTTPIVSHGRTLGALQLINKKGSSAFTPGELAVLHYLAHQAAAYLESRGE